MLHTCSACTRGREDACAGCSLQGAGAARPCAARRLLPPVPTLTLTHIYLTATQQTTHNNQQPEASHTQLRPQAQLSVTAHRPPREALNRTHGRTSLDPLTVATLVTHARALTRPPCLGIKSASKLASLGCVGNVPANPKSSQPTLLSAALTPRLACERAEGRSEKGHGQAPRRAAAAAPGGQTARLFRPRKRRRIGVPAKPSDLRKCDSRYRR